MSFLKFNIITQANPTNGKNVPNHCLIRDFNEIFRVNLDIPSIATTIQENPMSMYIYRMVKNSLTNKFTSSKISATRKGI